MRFFASDNAAGVHPEILEAIAEANQGHVLAYGHDRFTEAAVARFRQHFGDAIEVLLVFGGTGANVIGLRAVCESYQAVLCAETSHLWRDECAAGERFLGAKLIPVRSSAGRLSPDDLRPHLPATGDVHHAQPRVISVSQPTEWGTLYTREQLRELAELAHQHGLVLHVDGARLANAAAALDLPLSAFGRDAGVDLMSFGGTKNGLLAGEAILFFDPALVGAAEFHRKQGMQLASKMRFLAVQFDALLSGDLWLRSARHANAMARRLGEKLERLPRVELSAPVETNAVFPRLPPDVIKPLQRRYPFHVWDPATSVVRLMTAWDTTPEDVDGLVAALEELLHGS